ncbi:formyltransferase family protein [Rheinheimera tangshanensis]|jgi:methionyl-tRNA formyltransferase|uniref:Formyl transferase n=1 Tax=Rheinheimera tangshanensis TaxID=400153 RepID=A0A5C8LZA9_9GAMM|nr:formyltransferase family protein [Rheinheimera tangshanensis]TXK80430.1 formyl transferase [Rheinheimera tangshanensis]GGM61367.1 formyl transferase [Rheinheimera tangshanensis]
MRIGLIGCVKSSKMALETLLGIENIHVCAVITRQSSRLNSDFFDLSPICKLHNIPYHFEVPSGQDNSILFFQQFNLDLIYCIGWSHLLSEKMLNLSKLGVIGFHPTKLPRNRGRHPIIWSLALGLEETASTFFKMDAEADSGPILSQVNVPINHSDDAQDLYNRILDVAKEQLVRLTLQLTTGSVEYVMQNQMQASYWRKRSRIDGVIDFRMSANAIYNLVRALAPPYPCAELIFKGKYIPVVSASIAEEIFPVDIEPGFVLESLDSRILVKTSDSGAIWLNGIFENSIRAGDYL